MAGGIQDTALPERFTAENTEAEDHISSGDLSGAADILVRIIEKDPVNWRAFNNLGIISWTQEKWMDAYVMFCKSVSLNATYADALVNLFDAGLKLRKVKNVLPYFDQALAADNTLEEIKIIRDSAVNLGDDIYLSARAVSIGTWSATTEAAEKELEAGNLFKAMELFLKSNDEEGPSAPAYNGLGIISFYQQRYEDAYKLFLESIKLNPGDGETLLNLLDAARIIGRLKEAKDVFAVCRKEYPGLEAIEAEFENM